MFVNPNLMKEFMHGAGRDRWLRANSYQLQGRVQIEDIEYADDDNFNINSKVIGSRNNYRTYLEVEDGEIAGIFCECPDFHSGNGFCKHVCASYIEFVNNPQFKEDIAKDRTKYSKNISEYNKKYSNFLEILDTFYEEKEVLPKEDKIKEFTNEVHLEPKFFYSEYNKQLKVNFKIGIKQLYKLKSLSNFYNLMKNEEVYKYGAKLELIHKEKAFLEKDRDLLKFILEQAEIIDAVNSYNRSYYSNTLSDSEIIVTPIGLDKLFEILKDAIIDFENTYVTTKVKFVDNEPDIYFKIENINEKECKIKPNIEVYNSYTVLNGEKYTYFLMDGKLYRCSDKFKNTTLKLLEVFKRNITDEIIFSKEYLTSFYNIVIPKMENEIKIADKELVKLKEYIPEKLAVKMFLDMDSRGYITAKLKFCYGNTEINPLSQKEETDIARNLIQEKDIIIDITNAGFRLDEKNEILVMPNNDDIYEFLNNKIEEYMQNFEVLVTNNLINTQVKQPKIGTIGVKVENNLLNIDLSNISIDKKELQEIMQKYITKKKYHRLKNGSFITLEENKDLEFIDNLFKGMDIETKELEKDIIKLPVYRSMYLEKLLEKVENIEVRKEQNYKIMVRDIESKGKEENIELPEKIEPILRYYQKNGYNWLKTIDEYQFGGILADDMGLRKNSTNFSNYIRIRRKNRKRKKSSISCSCSKFACFKLEK